MKIKIFSILSAFVGIPGYALNSVNSNNSNESEISTYNNDEILNKNLGIDKKDKKSKNLISLLINKSLIQTKKEEISKNFKFSSKDDLNILVKYFSSIDFVKNIKKLNNLKKEEEKLLNQELPEFTITSQDNKNLTMFNLSVEKKGAENWIDGFFNDHPGNYSWTLSKSTEIINAFKKIHNILNNYQKQYKEIIKSINSNKDYFEINYINESKMELFNSCLTNLNDLIEKTMNLKTSNYSVLKKNQNNFTAWIEGMFSEELKKWEGANYINQCLNGTNNEEYKEKFKNIILSIEAKINSEVAKENKKILDAKIAEEAKKHVPNNPKQKNFRTILFTEDRIKGSSVGGLLAPVNNGSPITDPEHIAKIREFLIKQGIINPSSSQMPSLVKPTIIPASYNRKLNRN